MNPGDNMTDRPRINQDPLYHLLREGEIAEFNQRRAAGESCELSGTDLSRLDLREMHADGLDLSNAYFRMTDLRGVDFRNAKLEGASFASANISGCYFPKELGAGEILLSVTQGVRVRYGA